jgi:hypothetical protein
MEKENYIFEPEFQDVLIEALDYSPAKNASDILRKYIENRKIVAAYVKNSKYDITMGGFYLQYKRILINFKAAGIQLNELHKLSYPKDQLKNISMLLVHEMVHFTYDQLPKETIEVTRDTLKKFYKEFLSLSGVQNVDKETEKYLKILELPTNSKFFDVLSFLIELIKDSKNTKLSDKKTKVVLLNILLYAVSNKHLQLIDYAKANKKDFMKIQQIFTMCYKEAYNGVPSNQTFIQELYAPDEVLSSTADINTSQAIKTYTSVLKLLPKLV